MDRNNNDDNNKISKFWGTFFVLFSNKERNKTFEKESTAGICQSFPINWKKPQTCGGTNCQNELVPASQQLSSEAQWLCRWPGQEETKA